MFLKTQIRTSKNDKTLYNLKFQKIRHFFIKLKGLVNSKTKKSNRLNMHRANN